MKRQTFKELGYINQVDAETGEVLGWFTPANSVLGAIPETADAKYIQAVLNKVTEVAFNNTISMVFVERKEGSKNNRFSIEEEVTTTPPAG